MTAEVGHAALPNSNSDGRIINYDGGPQPASEEGILELCEPANTTIYCANNHPYSPQT